MSSLKQNPVPRYRDARVSQRDLPAGKPRRRPSWNTVWMFVVLTLMTIMMILGLKALLTGSPMPF